jgi:Leucine-rich repeat (LRR) protein/tRNA A-37 threonylcarbamoyl transferase component Bud32
VSEGPVERDEAMAILLAEALEQWRGSSGLDLASWQDQADQDEDFLPLLELMCSLEENLGPGPPHGDNTPSPVPQDVSMLSEAFCPRVLGRYRLVEQVGSGGMGAVYRAEDPQLQRVVAIKVPSFRGSRESRALAQQRFLREARAAAAIRHPHVCPVYDVGEQDNVPFVVMAFVEGKSLADMLRAEGRLDCRRAAELARQVAEGLAAVHTHGIVHRDLKPGNILLDTNGQALLADFGLARHLEDEPLTADGVLVGTPAYMAPEQTSSTAAPVGPLSDVYSLGVVLYHMLTGQVPFDGPPLSIIWKIAQQSPPPPSTLLPDLDPALEQILVKSMARRPEDRHLHAGALAEALAGWLSGESLNQTGAPDPATLAPGDPGHLATTADLLPAEKRQPDARGRWVKWGVAIGSFLLLLAAFTIVRIATKKGELVIDTDDPNVEVTVKGETAIVYDKVKDRRFVLTPGDYVVEVREQGGGVRFDTKKFTITRGDKVTFQVELKRPDKRARSAEPDAWLKRVATLPPEKLLEAVVARLKELNRGFQGQPAHKIVGDEVTELRLITDRVTDISPLRALVGLKVLDCSGSRRGTGRLADLSPLVGLKLTQLNCGNTEVSDVSPLKDMKLIHLTCYNTNVSRLSPLQNLPLVHLDCSFTRISDLSPLKGLPLKVLYCDHNRVIDLSPLKGLPLKVLYCNHTRVIDLSPLRGMGLKELRCDFTDIDDLSALKDTSLTWLRCDFTKIKDLSALEKTSLTWLQCEGTKVSDLTPLKGLKLKCLICSATKVTTLAPLKDQMDLKRLDCSGTGVSDLEPLKGLKLNALLCGYTKVSDLTPLKGMNLTELGCEHTKVTNLSVLRAMPLRDLKCNFKPDRDTEILRSITTLKTINNKPAKDFWKEIEEKQRKENRRQRD